MVGWEPEFLTADKTGFTQIFGQERKRTRIVYPQRGRDGKGFFEAKRILNF
jgi:hypothetical protein